MQNRESAKRCRQKNKESKLTEDEEKEFFKAENYRIHCENQNLIKEKNFLIEQLNFLQSLLKPSNKHF